MSGTAAAFGTPVEELLAQFEEANAEALANAQAPAPDAVPQAKPAKAKKARATIKKVALDPAASPAEPVPKAPKASKAKSKVVATATPPLPHVPGEPSLWEIVRIVGRKMLRAADGATRYVRLQLLRGHRQGLAIKKARETTKASA